MGSGVLGLCVWVLVHDLGSMACGLLGVRFGACRCGWLVKTENGAFLGGMLIVFELFYAGSGIWTSSKSQLLSNRILNCFLSRESLN
jgi:hypothetical protein